MKFKYIISIVLVFVTLFSLLTACDDSESPDGSIQAPEEVEINPELIAAFGQEFIDGEKETIANMINALQNCYYKYQQNGDANEFIVDIDKEMKPYKGYLKEISGELMNLYEEAKAEGNKDKMIELLTTYSSSVAYVVHETTCSFYKFDIENGMEPLHTDEEAAQAAIDYINAISEFFYCQPIAE